MPLCDLQFVDLYLGRSHGQAFCDVKALPGADAPRLPLPEELQVEVQAVRERLEATYRESGRPEFPLNHEGVLYRVTTFENPGDPAPFFTLSRVEAKIFPFARLNLPEHVASAVLASQTRGLVLIAGSMSSGKTSSAASILSERLRRHGGFAMAFEDPIETMLDGHAWRGPLHASRSLAPHRRLRRGAHACLARPCRHHARGRDPRR